MTALEAGKILADKGLLGKPWASKYNINRKWTIGRFGIRFSARSNDGFMGRFGGGWNWKLGVQVGGKTAIFSLLIAELTISIAKKDPAK